jgi:hypothetical protein
MKRTNSLPAGDPISSLRAIPQPPNVLYTDDLDIHYPRKDPPGCIPSR